jgi:hypothetical protein
MRYYLVDDLGRIVGQVERPRGAGGIVEYGTRDREGILHTHGLARIIPRSALSPRRREEIELNPPHLWD